MKNDADTIVAISTKLGIGAISIIRVSGQESISLVNSVFLGKDLTTVASHTIHYGYIQNQKETIDEVLVTVMRAPKTFTREDVVEINCHGGINPTLKIFELLQLQGARVAEPGEFTKRAFLNGRIDLTEAESIMDLIHSKNDTARKMALSSLHGTLRNFINRFRKELKRLLASIEVNIDYPEYYDIEEVTLEDVMKTITTLSKDLQELIQRSENCELVKNGIKTVIVGRPNVGKSSLLNAFLNQNKAIVTDIEGTTRDIVEGNILFDGIELTLIDTAGIHSTENIVEKIGVAKSLELIEEADLILVVLNGSQKLTIDDQQILEKVKDKNSIIIINKNDLPAQIQKTDLSFSHVVSTNTNTEEGINSLKSEIKKMFQLGNLIEQDASYLANTRQQVLAKAAFQSLEQAKTSLLNQQPIDLIAIDLKEVFDILGKMTGESYDDELLDELFASFCVGK